MHAHQDFAFLWNRPFDLSDFEYVGQTISVANQRFHSSFRAACHLRRERHRPDLVQLIRSRGDRECITPSGSLPSAST
jgi:hypothetical protein